MNRKNRDSIIAAKAFVKPLLFLLWLFLVACIDGHTQKITAVADRNKILIGEQAGLVIKAEDLNTRTTELQGWFRLEDSSKHIQVIKTDPVDTLELNGYTTYIQKIAITSFDSGRWVLPPVKLSLQERSTGKVLVIATDSIVLNVLPVDVSGLKEYHDIKEIQEVEVKPNYLLYAAIGLSVAGLVVLLWLLFRKKKKMVTELVTAYKETALAAALKKLRELEAENLPVQHKTKLFYTRLTDICRAYFFEQLQVSSTQLTSDELMLKLGMYFQQQKKKTEFYQLLRLADAVKFAKYISSSEENDNALMIAGDSLKHIDNMVQQVKASTSFLQQQHTRATQIN